MNKVTFLENLTELLDTYETKEIKSIIGDSTANNRTLTVRQVVRFLNAIGEEELGNQLEIVFSTVKPALQNNREIYNFRTDAYDINEFLFVVENATGNGSRIVTKALNSLTA